MSTLDKQNEEAALHTLLHSAAASYPSIRTNRKTKQKGDKN